MEYTSARLPTWGNTDHTAVDLIVDYTGHGELHTGAWHDSPEPHKRELYARAMAGDFGPIAEYVAPVPTQAQINAVALRELAAADAASVRGLREFILSKFADDPALPAQLAASEAKAALERKKVK